MKKFLLVEDNLFMLVKKLGLGAVKYKYLIKAHSTPFEMVKEIKKILEKYGK